ncbi:MAG: lipopolysaccharide biosynthesis protein [Acidobacteria bacterium]|nr:lipopolysaccharide biosynthesis protein [Acidobacteriota bacterium]
MRRSFSDDQATTHDVIARAVRSALWSYTSAAGSRLLVFASTVILARLLIPSEFGQVGFALLVISYLDTISDLGVTAALIYERKRSDEAANIAFIVSLTMGVLWLGLANVMAPLVAAFFKDPAVEPILRVMAWVFVITALGNTHDALLRRELAFKQRLIPDFSRALLKGLCSILLSLFGCGVWSLVWGQLMGAVAATLALWLVVPWRPRLAGSLDMARRMLRFGGQIVSVNVLAAVVHHVDYLIVGRLLGSAALGFYSMAYRIPEFFITMVIWAVSSVAFPAYSKLQEDPPALRRAFLATLRYLSLLTVPTGVGLAMLGSMVVSTLYGEQWAPSIPVLQALAIAGCLRSLGSHAGDIYKATGRPDILTKLALLRAVALIPALVWGAGFGIFGVALAQLAVTGASTLLSLCVASRILSIPIRNVLTELKPTLLSTVAMVFGLQLLQPVVSDWPNFLKLVVAVLSGFGIYAASTWFMSRDTLLRARTAIVSSFSKAM